MAIFSCHVSIKLPPKISDGQHFLQVFQRVDQQPTGGVRHVTAADQLLHAVPGCLGRPAEPVAEQEGELLDRPEEMLLNVHGLPRHLGGKVFRGRNVPFPLRRLQ